MDPVLVRAIDAAERVLHRHAGGEWVINTDLWPAPLAESQLDWLLLPWLCGRGGRALPTLTYRGADPRARVVALVGAGDHDAVMRFLGEHAGTMLVLFDASTYADAALADRLIDHAVDHGLRDPDVDGRMLAQTARPDLLLDLFGDPRTDADIGAIGELVIRGRDAGAPNARAEALWLGHSPTLGHYEASTWLASRDVSVRLAAREDPARALDLLDHWESGWPFHAFRDAPEAAIARLVQTDAARAVDFVASRPTMRRRIAWSRHLLRWGAMPEAAAPFFDDLLARHDHHVDLALAGIFATLDDSTWIERTFAGVARKRPLAIAATFAPALRRLRDRGDGARAESLRDRLLSLIADGVPERPFDPVDLLDAFSAPGAPTCTPFGHDLP